VIHTGLVAVQESLPAWKAVILGLVEGITEFLPVSSTGHLLVTERLLDLGTNSVTKDAIDAYTVIVQLGAIVAVLVVSWRRVLDVCNGLIGRSEKGRRLLINLIVSFIPAVFFGLLGKKVIEKHLLRPVPVGIAWIVGGVAILFLANRYRAAAKSGWTMDQLTTRHAAIIGGAQALALWPGVSRSLVTILAAVLVGMKLRDAVEYSFLLGLLTLGAASVYSIAKDGSLVGDTYGWSTPILGMVVAFVSALIAVKWMVAFLNNRDLTVFAFYRLAAGVVCLGLVVAGTI
jgi:undecaprenyl-diphosphatase